MHEAVFDHEELGLFRLFLFCRHDADLSGLDITVEIDLHAGEGSATVLTTDLSHAYVEENSAYSS